MFGLKEEIIAGLLAVALLVVAGFVWRLHWLGAEVDRQKQNAAVSQANYDAEHAARSLLLAERKADAELVAQHAQEAAQLRQALAARKHTIQGVYNASPTVRAWRDTPIPADLLAGLHQPAGGDPPGDHPADTTGRAAPDR